jgi:uncharacterized membrane protein YccC
MRGRIVFIVLAALVVAALAALNWPEFNRTEPLSFGVVTADVPLGLVMLTILAIVLAVFLVSSAIQESRYLLEHRRHSRALQAQRELAERAETSRFTDLREQLDTHQREGRHRDQMVATEVERRLVTSHNELREHFDRMFNAMLSRLSDIESRLSGSVRDARVDPVASNPRDRVPL